MQNSKNYLSKEIIIDSTLQLIDENAGIKNVTLRVIAKRLGCAHTNLYNYFSSLDEIFWESLEQALLRMIDYSEVHLNTEHSKEEGFYRIFSDLIDFFMEHPGWYKLIWLDTIGGSPSPEVVQTLRKPGKELIKIIMSINNNKLSEEEADFIGGILHGYLHGEMCKWINNRSFINSRQEVKSKILSNIKYLYKLMIK